MSHPVHAYTSITSNYLPKARVLANSVKGLDAQVQFHLVLSDVAPVGFNLADEPFDSVIYAEQLVTENFAPWAFGHSVVELCTAVKGAALQYIFAQHSAEQVYYFDPDIVVFGRLDELRETLGGASVVLTPHLTDPERTDRGILDNEMSALRHGIFNLGFVGVRNTTEGRRFADWWALRLSRYCHDDLERGIFTDQKWVDLVPCFFDEVMVLRSPAFNVATWNISNREATGSMAQGVLINGEPLGFYHFSGFDSGDQATMLEIYGADNAVLRELRQWYIEECEKHGQSAMGNLAARYDFFSNGERIGRGYRVLYRQREDLQMAYPNPLLVEGSNCYKAWYDAHPEEQLPVGKVKISPATPLSILLEEVAAHVQQRIIAGGARSRVKRLLMRLFVKGLRVMASLTRPAGSNA